MLRTCSAYEMSSAVEVPMPIPRNQSEDNLLTIATEPQVPVPKLRARNQTSLDSLTSPTGETATTVVAPSIPHNDAMANNVIIPVSADVDQGTNEKPPAIPAVRPAALVQNINAEQPPVPKPRKDLMKSNVEPSRHASAVPAPRPTDISDLGSPGMEAPPPPSAYLGDPGSPPPPSPTEEIVNQFYQQNGMNGLMREAPGPAVPPRPKAGPAAPPTVPSRSAPPPPVPPRRDLVNK